MTAFNMKARNYFSADVVILELNNSQEEQIYEVNTKLKTKCTSLICVVTVLSFEFF